MLFRKQQQLEQENKDDNNNNNNDNNVEGEIEMVDRNKSNKLKQWIQTLLDKLENKGQKKEKNKNEKEKEEEKGKEKEKQKEKVKDPLNAIQLKLTNISKTNGKQFVNHMKLMESIKIKDISELT